MLLAQFRGVTRNCQAGHTLRLLAGGRQALTQHGSTVVSSALELSAPCS